MSETPARPRPTRISLFLHDLLPTLAALLIFSAGLGVGWLIWGRAATPAAPSAQATSGAPVRYPVEAGGNPALGPADAPVTVIEFSDFQCPYCQRWHEQVFAQLMKDYAGKVRFVYRDFPLKSIHPQAVPAAEAANCALAQNAYWEFHNALFSGKYGLNTENFSQYAADLGLDVAAFKQCVETRQFASEVEADFEYASGLGITSTPTFFINGLAVVGAQPYEVFKQVIDSELAGK
ncbi:MAG: hypothetical protein Fur0035_23000 [Anaerolineales bacterium]